MKKNIITNKISPCCSLPFSVVYWWVSNLTLNSEADRQFILSKMSQNGTISIDGWKMIINSGTLEIDSPLTKAEFLGWFDCERQPSCEQLKVLIEAYKLSNFNPLDEYGVGWTKLTNFEAYNEKVIKKIVGYVGGVGSLPNELSERIGKYYAENATLTDNKDLAVDFKPIGLGNVIDGFESTSINEAGSAKNDKILHDAIKNLNFTPPIIPETNGTLQITESTGSPTNYSDNSGVVHIEKGSVAYSAKPIKFDGNKINYNKDGVWIIVGNLSTAPNVYPAISLPVGMQVYSITSFYNDGTYYPTSLVSSPTLIPITNEPKYILYKSDRIEFYQGGLLLVTILHSQFSSLGYGGFGEKRFGLIAEAKVPILEYTYSIKIAELNPQIDGVRVEKMFLSNAETFGNDVQIVGNVLKYKKKTFAGKTIDFLGDSIAVSYDSLIFENLLKNKTEALKVNRRGISGGAFASNLQTDAVINSVIADNPELVIIHGVNDARSGGAIGDMNDVAGASTMIGGYKKIINALVNHNKNIEIIICTPITYGGAAGGWENVRSDMPVNGKYLWEYRKALIEFAASYGIEIVDLTTKCGFRPQIESDSRRVYTLDGIHPNGAGYEVMSNLISNVVNNM